MKWLSSDFNWPATNPACQAPMRLLDYDVNKTACKWVALSDRAYASILSEVLRNQENETGGVLLGNAWRKLWFVVDTVDPGINVSHSAFDFVMDVDYVNRISSRVSQYYKYPLTILGFWHRHPKNMDYFSPTDEITIQANLREASQGLLSMLVNVDPEFRMTFYYCYGDMMMKVPYDYGDQYFPEELLACATADELIARSATPHLLIKPNQNMNPDKIPRSILTRAPGTADDTPGSGEPEPDETAKAGEKDLEPYPAEVLNSGGISVKIVTYLP